MDPGLQASEIESIAEHRIEMIKQNQTENFALRDDYIEEDESAARDIRGFKEKGEGFSFDDASLVYLGIN